MKLEEELPLEEKVIKLFRCATVVKGGRRFSFAALVVVGDRNGHIGVGYGKANEVPMAVDKGIKDARKNIESISLKGQSIPHEVVGRFGACRVIMVPASKGTGVIAGGTIRPMLELAGVHDVLTKAYGSTNAKNLIKATLNGLRALRNREQVSKLRGVAIG